MEEGPAELVVELMIEQVCQGQGHREEGENISLEDLQLGGWRDLGRQVLLGSSQDLNLPGKEWFDGGGIRYQVSPDHYVRMHLIGMTHLWPKDNFLYCSYEGQVESSLWEGAVNPESWSS